jgi:hypothetical protein
MERLTLLARASLGAASSNSARALAVEVLALGPVELLMRSDG